MAPPARAHLPTINDHGYSDRPYQACIVIAAAIGDTHGAAISLPGGKLILLGIALGTAVGRFGPWPL